MNHILPEVPSQKLGGIGYQPYSLFSSVFNLVHNLTEVSTNVFHDHHVNTFTKPVMIVSHDTLSKKKSTSKTISKSNIPVATATHHISQLISSLKFRDRPEVQDSHHGSSVTPEQIDTIGAIRQSSQMLNSIIHPKQASSTSMLLACFGNRELTRYACYGL